MTNLNFKIAKKLKFIQMKTRFVSLLAMILFLLIQTACINKVQENKTEPQSTVKTTERQAEKAYVTKRINKCIELLEKGQPIYYQGAYGGYEEGKKLADTWADYIMYNMEHNPLDFNALKEFMRALVENGPMASGHRTPTVIASMPVLGLDGPTMRANGWMIEQALACGVHGIHLARARNPEAVIEYIRAARYPIHKQAEDVLGVGFRGYGSQKFAAWVWGISEEEYLKKADVWPLNPDGELMMGAKIEDPEALENAEETLKIPGLCFAEHGPRDMGLSYGHLEGRADPPLPPEVDAAGQKVLNLCKAYHLFFLDNVLPDNVEQKLEWGVMIGAGSNKEAATKGRKYTKREMPW